MKECEREKERQRLKLLEKKNSFGFQLCVQFTTFIHRIFFFTMNFNVSKTGMHKLHFVTINFQVTLSTLHYDPTNLIKNNVKKQT